MYSFNQETLLLSDSDIEILKREIKKNKISFWKSLGILILIIPIGPFLGKVPHVIHDFNEYKMQVIQGAILLFIVTTLFHSLIVYRIKKDLINRTKIRFKTTIEKTKDNSKIYKWGAKYCDIILDPIEKIQELEKPKGLLYYLKKNIFPSKKFTIQIPVSIYPSLNDGEGIIEVSKLSKTFLSFNPISNN